MSPVDLGDPVILSKIYFSPHTIRYRAIIVTHSRSILRNYSDNRTSKIRKGGLTVIPDLQNNMNSL